MPFNVTDLDLLKEFEYHALENGDADADGTAFLTTMYTVQEAIDALNDRQRRFMKETGVVYKRTTVGAVPGQGRYNLPSDWIETRHVSWTAFAGATTHVPRSDTWDLDNGLPDWSFTTDPKPTVFHESTLETLKFEVARAPNDVGTLNLLYVGLTTLLDGTGIALDIPDEFSWAVLWGTLGDLLTSEGEGNDPKRAAYCEQRFEMGVELARILLGGPVNA